MGTTPQFGKEELSKEDTNPLEVQKKVEEFVKEVAEKKAANPGQPTINLRGQHPAMNNQRMHYCQNIREIGAQRIITAGSKFEVFVNKYVDDNGEVTDIEIDWEFCLFKATMYQFQELFNSFMVSRKDAVKIKPKYKGKAK